MNLAVIAARILHVGPWIRYVAVLRGDDLYMVERGGLSGASSSSSDRYEELLVNPALLTLTRQRGTIDCGGLDFVLVGYRNFRQLVIPIPDGHVSVALERSSVSIEGLGTIVDIAREGTGTVAE